MANHTNLFVASPAWLDGLTLADALSEYVLGFDLPDWVGEELLEINGGKWALSMDGEALLASFARRRSVNPGNIEKRLAPDPALSDQGHADRESDLVRYVGGSWMQLLSWLQTGELVARGRIDPLGQPAPLPPEIWSDERYWITTKRGDLVYVERGDNVVCHRLTLELPSRPPIAPGEMEGMLLTEALARFVCRDDDVWALSRLAVRAGEEKIHIFQNGVREATKGLFWGKFGNERNWWPLTLVDPTGYLRTAPVASRFQSLVRKKMERFLAPLITGAVVAEGFDQSGRRSQVPVEVWRAQATLIHADEPSIGSTGEKLVQSVNGVARTWTGVHLRSAVPIVEVARPVSEAPAEDAGRRGAPPQYEWFEALDHAFFRVLTDRNPKSGAEFARWLEQWFLDQGKEPPSDIERRLRKDFQKVWDVFKRK